MKRGEVWTLRDRGCASKARPVVIVQNDAVESFDSVILCLLTTYDSKEMPTRVYAEPDEGNGLSKPSYVMTEKVVTVDRAMLGQRIGVLAGDVMASISEQLKVLLGLG